MVSLPTLKYLATERRKDAEVLFQNNRNSGAIYLMGYVIELSLKRKVGQVLGFNNGFPETVADFNSYTNEIARFTRNTGIALTQLRQIKNHDLNTLLVFSGYQSIILGNYYKEWNEIEVWTPESRYKRKRLTNNKANFFLDSAKVILKEIV